MTPATSRVQKTAARREAIIDAALDEFTEKGFAAARMDEIARRAGVAKGTIYLNFSDKEALFEAIVRQEITPLVDAVSSASDSDEPFRGIVTQHLLPIIRDLANSRRGSVVRLLIAETGRFPKLAEVYYRMVVEPGLGAIGKLAHRAHMRGELRSDALAQFPQLFIAPGILAIVWTRLFERFRHLDIEHMASAYFDQFFSPTDEFVGPPQRNSHTNRRRRT
ncbi:MAG: TetR/AcrR family transcriptional regulator [Bryobacteraceae bacterium]